MKHLLLLILVAGLFMPARAVPDTIYKWTDEQGVLRFSSSPPPENVQKYEKIESKTPPSETVDPEYRRRSDYDTMVERSSRDARQMEQQRKAEAAAQEADALRKKQARHKEKVASERKRLEQQIKAIENRAISPTYSQGMKKAQIDKLKEQIKRLEQDPDAARHKD